MNLCIIQVAHAGDASQIAAALAAAYPQCRFAAGPADHAPACLVTLIAAPTAQAHMPPLLRRLKAWSAGYAACLRDVRALSQRRLP